jgi:tRNA threonylcarbamoyladenosine biosynthesis protein TsaE
LTSALWQFHSDSPTATLALGAAIARHIQGGSVLALIGPLGAGKTMLVKGIAAENANGSCEVTSPTFTLVQEYPGRLKIFHLDVYRLPSTSDPLLLALAEMIASDSIAIIEWADRIRSVLPHDTLWIEISPMGESARLFSFHADGPLSLQCLQALRSAVVDTNLAGS